ncbi:LysE family translocator [Hyalangium versicolor]|uniref:LysE family translocator n=1 Tax=Hyalangium versicolor TaxID=2861190 RepID=UPI001CD03110|nr:LysE family translocator [Hyalangium versicolor]
MPEASTLALFFAAALVLLITPGPSVLYIVARSVDQGRVAGIVSALGIGTATLFHIAAAALGVSALLMSSATVFQAVKYLGAAYLIYLGVRALLARGTPQQVAVPERLELRRIFSQGVLVNLLNPKTALFVFAFLPQFVEPSRGPVAVQIVLLGLMFVTMGFVSDGAYALLAGALAGWLKGNPRFLRAQRYFAGCAYVALGVVAALSGSFRSP